MTTNTSAAWTIESSENKQAMFAVLGIVVGAALMFGSRNAHGLESFTTRSALILGLLILSISVVVLVRGGKQIITVDPPMRRILIEGISRFGTTRRLIPFSQINDVYVGELGDREGGSISYHVVVKLVDGKKVNLFIGAFEGAYDCSVMEGRCHRILENLEQR
jgi:hypothetical protein